MYNSRTSFFLYTPENGVNNPIQFEFGASGNDLLAAGFHPERSTKILSHGWNSDGLGFCREFVEGKNKKMKTYFSIIYYDLVDKFIKSLLILKTVDI